MDDAIAATRILIVDDNEVTRMVIYEMISGLGFKNVTLANEGTMGLKQFEDHARSKNAFGLVLCDWKMPGLTGLELLKRVRMYHRTPFILITSVSDRDSVTEAVETGVTEYLVKPFDQKSLQQKIMSSLTQKDDK